MESNLRMASLLSFAAIAIGTELGLLFAGRFDMALVLPLMIMIFWKLVDLNFQLILKEVGLSHRPTKEVE